MLILHQVGPHILDFRNLIRINHGAKMRAHIVKHVDFQGFSVQGFHMHLLNSILFSLFFSLTLQVAPKIPSEWNIQGVHSASVVVFRTLPVGKDKNILFL